MNLRKSNLFSTTISVSFLFLFPRFIVFCNICQFCNYLVAVMWLIIMIRNVNIGYCTRVTIVVWTTLLIYSWFEFRVLHFRITIWNPFVGLLFFVLFLSIISRSCNFHSEVIHLVIQIVFIIIQDKKHCFILICLILSHMRYNVGQLKLNLPLNV